MPAGYLQVDKTGAIKDENNREIILRGINLDGGSKLPVQQTSFFEKVDDSYWDGDNISFVNRPFLLEDAPTHFAKLKSYGFNTIRYVFTWEALEHKGPGIYDDEFIDFTIKVLKILDEFGFYVFMDPHQDNWSRYSGGSGAPLWTYYAMGLDPRAFETTQACLVQSHHEDPESYPKMFWPTNYARLACQTAFTLFNAGLDFAPNAIIDGKNIELYLQDHLLDALSYFYRRIMNETDLMNRTIIGVETLNELNRGLVGHEDISKHSIHMHLKLGVTPTALEGMILGMGKPCEVEVYKFGRLRPKLVGKKLIDPKGVTAWLSKDYDDTRYGWKRDPKWKLGECIWAQHGVWDIETNKPLKLDYFKYAPDGRFADDTTFNTIYFTRYWERFYTAMRKIDKEMFLFCQPPTMSVPPKLKDSPYMDSRIIYAPHYYDGLTMVQKHWSTLWNVDVLGILRGRYLAPPFAIKLGENAIRECISSQVTAMREEGRENIGITPCFMSETGMPFDLDDKSAYKTGNYSSQIKAWDTLGHALEKSKIHHTLWVYSAQNSHRFGDYWNGEDFSIYSHGHDHALEHGDDDDVDHHIKVSKAHATRADRAIARPFPLTVSGALKTYKFHMEKGVFHLHIDGLDCLESKKGTEIALPAFSFPKNNFNIKVTSGRYEFNSEERVVVWWHGAGDQELEIESTLLPPPIKAPTLREKLKQNEDQVNYFVVMLTLALLLLSLVIV